MKLQGVPDNIVSEILLNAMPYHSQLPHQKVEDLHLAHSTAQILTKEDSPRTGSSDGNLRRNEARRNKCAPENGTGEPLLLAR